MEQMKKFQNLLQQNAQPNYNMEFAKNEGKEM
jgi:hypothetical protein